MFPERQDLGVEHCGDGVEVGADKRLHVVAQGVNLAVARVVRLHLGKAAQIEPILFVHPRRVVEPAVGEELHIFHVVHHPLDFTVVRVEHTRGDKLMRADLDIVAPASAGVLAREEISELARAVHLGRVVRDPGAVAQGQGRGLRLGPAIGAEDVGAQFGSVLKCEVRGAKCQFRFRGVLRSSGGDRHSL